MQIILIGTTTSKFEVVVVKHLNFKCLTNFLANVGWKSLATNSNIEQKAHEMSNAKSYFLWWLASAQ